MSWWRSEWLLPVDPTMYGEAMKGRLRFDLGAQIELAGRAAIGASRPLRRIPAIVSFLNA